MELDEVKAQTRATYNLAADQFDIAPLAPWATVGRRTIELLGLSAGNRVLDICCGSGSTALPAAQAVGRFGTVVGVDLAEELLALGIRKATAQGLANVQFRAADFERMPFPTSSCDAVICQFGIFFMADMTGALRRMWSLVAPGGALAVTTWGTRIADPVGGFFREALKEVRPDLATEASKCQEVDSAVGLKALFAAAAVSEPEVSSEVLVRELACAEDYWPSVEGSGARRLIEAMGPEAAGRLRLEVADRIARASVTSMESDVLYAVARRPPEPAIRDREARKPKGGLA